MRQGIVNLRGNAIAFQQPGLTHRLAFPGDFCGAVRPAPQEYYADDCPVRHHCDREINAVDSNETVAEIVLVDPPHQGRDE